MINKRVKTIPHNQLTRSAWHKEGVVTERRVCLQVEEFYVQYDPPPSDPRACKGLWLPIDMFAVI